MRILVPGIAGGLARHVALHLVQAGHEVAGLDARPWKGAPDAIRIHSMDIRKRAAEEVFRRFRPQCVVHMATVPANAADPEERYRINLGGTRAVFEHAAEWGVEHVVFVGRHTYYGADADSPLYHTESEPPVALGSWPELADLVAADLYAATALWRLPRMTTTVLRLVYTLGPSGHGTLASFLRWRRVPMSLGFDPLFQFLHEDDAAAAVALAVEKRLSGIYNVAGPQPLPLSAIVREAGRRPVPLPGFLLRRLVGRAGLPGLAPGALVHIRYPIVVDAAAYARATGFHHRWDELRTVRPFAEAFPAPG